MTRMNRSIAVATLSGTVLWLASLATPAVAVGSERHADFVGRWQGSLSVNDTQLRLVFEIGESDEGTLEATLDSPDQGVSGIPVATVTVKGDSIRLELPAIGADYSGRLGEGKRTLEGEWRQSGLALPLTIERADEPTDARADD